MRKEVMAGRMIGGPGWTSQKIRQFFSGKEFYGVPCSATTKDGDPRGRIVHDYGFFKRGSYSINAAHSSTSVEYSKEVERMQVLEHVVWYIKADLSSGFRQFGTHPRDWRFQVYCNGHDEHYIDLACPFGKTNSPLEFCAPVTLFVKSVAARYPQERGEPAPNLSSYVYDIFGGLPHVDLLSKALDLRRYICETGTLLTLEFNLKPSKTPLPARKQMILGRLYNSL